MTMAAAIEDRTADSNAWSKRAASPPSTSFTTSAPPKASGAASEARQTFFTPYQRFDFLSPWQRQVGEREGLVPFIVIAYDAERRPLVLLPLTLRHAYGARCASFMGGKHSTFNMALFDRDFAASATQGRSRRPDIGDIAAIRSRRPHPASATASLARSAQPASRCCRISPPPMIARSW
jgi:CelD/BcsL family acetyltransferase involved in cellulose biosynthesis